MKSLAKPRITFFLQDLGPGGAQRHTVGLLRGLHDRFNFSAVLQEPVLDDGIIGISPQFEISRPSVDECRMPRSKRWLAACERVAATRPDLVVNINQVATIVGLIGKFRGIVKCPIATIFHSTEIGNYAGWLRTLPFIPAARMSDGLFYISENQKQIWQRRWLSARRVWTIRNGIDLDRLVPVEQGIRLRTRAELGLVDGDFVIGCLAVLRHEKNHLQQIDALSLLRQQGLSAKLLLVGDGPMRPQIEARIFEKGMQDHVVLAGMQQDVSRYIAAMDLGWITSLSIETLSLAALECMALGVPMVMSDIGGASEIVTPGLNGHLFPAGDTQALVGAVLALSEPAVRQRVSQSARETVYATFGAHKMLDDYASAFEQLSRGACRS